MHDTHTLPIRETPSDEADPAGLALAREVGGAYGRAVQHMAQNVADGGDEIAAGDYMIGYAFESPEGMYHVRDGRLVWEEPGDTNLHLEVTVRDGGDGRFVPYLDVTAILTGSAGNATEPVQLPFLWHPTLFHYGANVRIPGSDLYMITIIVAPPTFARHDRRNGDRYATQVIAKFRGVRLTPSAAK